MKSFFWFIRSSGYFVYSCIEYKKWIESIKKCIELYKIKKFFHSFPACCSVDIYNLCKTCHTYDKLFLPVRLELEFTYN